MCQVCSRSAQPFGRPYGTNRQTNKQTNKHIAFYYIDYLLFIYTCGESTLAECNCVAGCTGDGVCCRCRNSTEQSGTENDRFSTKVYPHLHPGGFQRHHSIYQSDHERRLQRCMGQLLLEIIQAWFTGM